MYIITQNHIIEFLAFLTSLIYFKGLRNGKLKSLPFFLGFMFLIELLGAYLRKILHLNNVWLYNLSIPIEYGYYLFLFWLHGRRVLKNVAKFGLLVVGLSFLFYLFLLPIKELHTNVLVFGQLFVIISSCVYVYELFRDGAEESLLKNYFYWLVVGLFLFNLGDIIYFVFYPAIHQNGWDKLDHIFESINRNLLLLLYLSYIVAIIISQKYQQPSNARSS